MSAKLRLLLVLISLLTLLFFLRKISRSKLRISHATCWILFSCCLLADSLFPRRADRAARLLGIYSTQNLIFLLAIGMLVYQLFLTTLRLSKLNEQVGSLTQELAIYRCLTEKKEEASRSGESRQQRGLQ